MRATLGVLTHWSRRCVTATVAVGFVAPGSAAGSTTSCPAPTFMRGTLNLLSLRAHTAGPDHGLGIARRVERRPLPATESAGGRAG